MTQTNGLDLDYNQLQPALDSDGKRHWSDYIGSMMLVPNNLPVQMTFTYITFCIMAIMTKISVITVQCLLQLIIILHQALLAQL